MVLFFGVNTFKLLVPVFCILVPNLSNCQNVLNPNDLLNTCLDSQNHKSKPGPEAALFNLCEPWKDSSCCTQETSIQIHHTDMYNFTYNHCEGETGHKLSKECKLHFDQDMCFFECEPHIGPWKVQVKRKFANERFYQVPICASDCDTWFNACRLDYTCVANWPRGMKFNKGVNSCPSNTQCITFDKMYGNAKNFCEQVWDFSWKYTPDTQSCMRMWFNGTKGNPNERTAMLKIREMIQNAPGAASIISLNNLLTLVSLTTLTLVNELYL